MNKSSRVTIGFTMRAAAVVTLGLGVTMIAFPSELLHWFGNGSGNQHFAIYLGTSLIGFSVINWLFSRADDPQTLKPVIYGNLASLVIASVIDTVTLARGSVSQSIWLILILHLVFVAAFVYCLRLLSDGG
jgi:hypothetical protein